MPPDPQLSKPLQIKNFKALFSRLNPGIGVDVIDWEKVVVEGEYSMENLENLAEEYPQYRWTEDEKELAALKQRELEEHREELDYMLHSLPEEMQPDYKKLFDEHLFLIDYKLTKGIDLTKERRKTKELLKQLEEAKREARRAGREEPTPEEVKRHVEAPPLPRPPAWTSRLERKLEDVFKAAFTREGMRATPFMSEYRIELVDITMLPTEDAMVAAVEAFAREIILREQARKVKPPPVEKWLRPPPEAPPPFISEEEEPGIPYEAPYVEFPVAAEKGFYPSRRLTSTELRDVEEAFYSAVLGCGKFPDRYTREFNDWIGEELFNSWSHVKNNFETLVKMICTGVTYAKPPRALPYEELFPLIQWQVSLKTERPEDWMIPWSLKPPKHETIEDVIAELEKLGKPGIRRKDVVEAVKQGWKDKASSFIHIGKEYLETLIGESLQ